MTESHVSELQGSLMVCGTASDVGKSSVVTGLCRLLARKGVSVAPFKAQNMALNSWVTIDGAEIGRAQGVQAAAAGIPAEVAMNPILLKPTGERTSQVVVMGSPWADLDAAAYHAAKPALFALVQDALADLRSRYDVVLCEGAGSPAEINLLDNDLVNLRLAVAAGIRAIVVGDIDRGGVFAHLYGTVALLPNPLRECVKGFIVNKFRGDPGLLLSGFEDLLHRTGVPTLGVLPMLQGMALDAEDSLGIAGGWSASLQASPSGDTSTHKGPEGVPYDEGLLGESALDGALLDVAVVRLPFVSNITDIDALAAEPGVSVRLVEYPKALGDPDLIVLPGTKSTVGDLDWLRRSGMATAIDAIARRPGGPVVLGVCGGYQMLGSRIVDGVESTEMVVEGLGLLPHETVFDKSKITRQVFGVVDQALGGVMSGVPFSGYEIRHGRPVSPASQPSLFDQTHGGPSRAKGVGEMAPTAVPWLRLKATERTAPGAPLPSEGLVDLPAGVFGTSVHGLFESDGFRSTFLQLVAERRGKRFATGKVSFAALRESRFDRLADAIEEHVDVDAILRLVSQGAS